MQTRIWAGLFAGTVSAIVPLPVAGAEEPWSPVDAGRDLTQEELLRRETVTTRRRPELEPLGARLGGFLFYPAFALSEEYNDNILAADSNRRGDFITEAAPSARLRSNWNNHALNFDAGARLGRYLDHTSENYDDFRLGTDGRLDITRDSYLAGRANYARLHEMRGAPDGVPSAEPVVYRLADADAAFFQRFNRVSVAVDTTARRYVYDDVAAAGGGTIGNGDRDRDEFLGGVRTAYEIIPGYEAFLRGRADRRVYDRTRDDNGFERGSKGYEAVIGTDIEFSGITWGQVFVGYAAQDYDDPRLPTVSGPSFGGSLTWNATPLVTLTGSIRRTIEETIFVGASGYIATRSQLRADWELLRNLIVTGDLTHTNRDFKGISLRHNDFEAGLGAKYMLNRHLYLSLGYALWLRDASGSAAGAGDFTQNRAMLRLETQL